VLSPCILPVLPFLFARGGGTFRSDTLPMLASMALAFAALTSLAAVGGAWAVTLNVYARHAAMALLALFGVALLLPRIAERLARPLVRLGEQVSSGTAGSRLAPLALGVGTGLLWAPCAGPILGVLLAGAALNGPGVETAFLLLAFAAGACTALALAWWFGRGATSVLRRILPAADRLRRVAGAAVLAGVAIPALGLDASVLTRIPTPATTALEQKLVERVHAKSTASQGPLSALSGATGWINSPALDADSLRGKVVLVNFWTYSCINCLRTLPYLRAWAEKYRDAGLVIVGVHTPEFAFEKSPANVRRAIADLGISYPVATDNNFAVWRGFHNQSWPAFHFIDSQGRLRQQVAGEHAYERSERMIQALLAEAGPATPASEPVRPQGQGTQAAADVASLFSGESYVGYERATGFTSRTRLQKDREATYTPPDALRSGDWSLAGHWRVEAERAVAVRPQGRILHRFRARDLHMVLGPAPDGRPVRFVVRLDGKPVGADHGSDTNALGEGVVDRQKLYQLVRQRSPGQEHLFEIEFLDEGAEAYAFTFG
jgi:cytochrome c biogenesis protein CcdA/thiol-disulfide isomerase/thioredoxin